MKAGKEEIMGLLAAVEQWVVRDHAAEWREWERRLAVIADAVEKFPSVTTQVNQPGRSNVAPNLAVRWDRERLAISGHELARQLSAGQPRIEVPAQESGFGINPYMMEPGEEDIVVQRISEVLAAV